jgi:uncharacterized lipoprotein YddW (UPF0748 family)
LTADLTRRGLLAGAAALAGCVALDAPSTPSAAPAAATTPDPDAPPPPLREFRAAWVATVAHIDWPSSAGLAAAQQRAEALAILDRAQATGLNALILQVRPAADALYPSTLEPWSELLSGEQGRAPQPPWDPLAFWVREAHARALELHAWFNPFRARHSSARSGPSAGHRAITHPAQVKRYGDQLWMDPGDTAAAEHSLAVVADVLRRYDVDGIHIDDYFYPYPLAAPGAAPGSGAELPFPDDDSYAAYRLAGGALARDDWRRDNVNRYVRRFFEQARRIKPWVRVGVSPFGIGRPDRRPAGITGFSQYDKLFADVELWLAEGWLDYLAPQLYWPRDREGQRFALLLDQWVAENAKGRHLWPGLFTSQVTRGEPLGARSWPAAEIVAQVEEQRQRGERAGGHIHFSMVALMQDRDGIATRLRETSYAQPALVPASPWLGDPAPAAAALRRDAGNRLRIEGGAGAARWAVWRRDTAGRWRLGVQPVHDRGVEPQGAAAVAVAAVGRTGTLGPHFTLPLQSAHAGALQGRR